MKNLELSIFLLLCRRGGEIICWELLMFHTPVFVQQLKSRDISFFTKRQEISRFQLSWHLSTYVCFIKMSKQEPKLWRIKPFQVQKDLQANIQVQMRLDVMSRILFNVHGHVWCFFNMLPQNPAQFNNKTTMNTFESFWCVFYFWLRNLS